MRIGFVFVKSIKGNTFTGPSDNGVCLGEEISFKSSVMDSGAILFSVTLGGNSTQCLCVVHPQDHQHDCGPADEFISTPIEGSDLICYLSVNVTESINGATVSVFNVGGDGGQIGSSYTICVIGMFHDYIAVW